MGMPIETNTFACMAEAVAHYYNMGYKTLNTSKSTEDGTTIRRVMIKNPEQMLSPMVEILKVGFLKVEVRELV